MVVQLSTGTSVLAANPMALLVGTQAVYTYSWSTTGMLVGDYASIVSYAADGVTINGRLLEVFHLGDTNITGPVALAATTAQQDTVALDATVAHLTDLATINPNTSTVVLSIQAKTSNLPSDPVSYATLATLLSNVQGIHDYQFGTWTIDKTQNPNVLTILSPAQAVLASFTLSDSTTATQRLPR